MARRRTTALPNVHRRGDVCANSFAELSRNTAVMHLRRSRELVVKLCRDPGAKKSV